jgi:hypothetical protein
MPRHSPFFVTPTQGFSVGASFRAGRRRRSGGPVNAVAHGIRTAELHSPRGRSGAEG